MAFGGSSSAHGARQIGRRTQLPLVPCPKCGEDIVELECGEGSKVPGAVFFKCRLHERDVPGTCPWYLFADKYERMLIARGILQKSGTTVSSIRPAEPLPEVEQIRIAIGRIEGLVEANMTEFAPFLDDVASLNNVACTVDEKLEKLIVIGKFATLCLVVVVVCAVVGVIAMLLK